MKLVAAAIFIFLLVSCVSPSKNEPVKIGAILTLTGFASQWGENARKGMELAKDEINSQGGINGVPLEILYEDYKELDLKIAATAAQKFANVDEVRVILTQFSGDTEVVFPIAEQNNIITLSVAAGAKDLTKKSSLLFRVWPSDELFVKRAVDYVLANGATVAAILGEDEAYFNSLRTINEEYWQEKTGDSAFVQVIPQQTTDLRTPLSKIKEKSPDVLFFQTTILIEGLALKQMKEIGLNPKFILGVVSSDDPTVLSTARDAAEGLIYPEYSPSAETFVQKFKAKYGVEPGIAADTSYDAIMILAKIMREKDTSTTTIKTGLHEVNDYSGASGIITIDETGDRVGREVILKRIRNGKGEVLN